LDTRDLHGGGRRKIRGLRRRPFTLHEIERTPDRPGLYLLYNKRKKPIYVGSAGKAKKPANGEKPRGVRSRLRDEYYQRGDARTVPRKIHLAEKAAFFDVQLNNRVYENRERERRLKRQLKPQFNLK
jgi:excinuclease UvrABC nuclease subunit